MKNPRRRGVLIVLLLMFLFASTIVWFLSGDLGDRRVEARGTGAAGGTSSSITITGDITGPIRPGAMEPLDLSFANGNGFSLRVGEVLVSIHDIDAPQADADHPCSADDFVVRQLADDVRLALGSDRTADLSGLGTPQAQWPAVGMIDRPVNQDGCKGAVLTLSYTAHGTEVNS